MILGIDYGAKRIGLAIADEKIGLVLPFKEISNSGLEETAKEISRIVAQEKITKIVVGLPVGLGGQQTQKTKETQKFIDILAKKMIIPIAAADERLTSKLTDVLSLGTKGSRDIGAAMIILEDYLQRQKVGL